MKIKLLLSLKNLIFFGLTLAGLQGNLLWTSAGSACAQASAATALRLGDTFSIESKRLGESRHINIYVPAVYYDSASLRLPVLYMSDGGLAEDFLHVAGLVQGSVANETMRPFLLVGIENTARRRDLTGPTTSAEDRQMAPQVGGSAAFRQFCATSLCPKFGDATAPRPKRR